MELMVVATDEVGLPEMVMPPWGVLVPTHDADALAEAILEMLSFSGSERARRGAAAREWIAANCTVAGETARLLELVDQAAGGASASRR